MGRGWRAVDFWVLRSPSVPSFCIDSGASRLHRHPRLDVKAFLMALPAPYCVAKCSKVTKICLILGELGVSREYKFLNKRVQTGFNLVSLWSKGIIHCQNSMFKSEEVSIWEQHIPLAPRSSMGPPGGSSRRVEFRVWKPELYLSKSPGLLCLKNASDLQLFVY